MHKDYWTVSNKLTHAFEELEENGYFARQTFLCCQSCGCYEIETEHPDKVNSYVFYHSQDDDGMKEDGEVYLAWAGDPELIVKVLSKHGLNATYENSETRILVSNNPNFKRNKI